MTNEKKVEWTLRITVAGEFLGHGVFALQGKEGWFPYFNVIGMTDPAQITQLLQLIGIMDIILAVLVLVRLIPILLLWMTLWGTWTAVLRPLAGEPIWDFVEQFANIGAPLALFFVQGIPRSVKGWFK
ncbi:hypothetical protein CL654_02180 [bacterium]|nr:hypothetical protein [bacterium]|tara:strand:- start:8751 stop:9134 length:384 start_codon:yes stop_codon:yes gene_type:complete